MELRTYTTSAGRKPFEEWLSALADRQARARIAARVARIEAGNLGDRNPLLDGVQKLRIDHGPGYQMYLSLRGRAIALAIEYLND